MNLRLGIEPSRRMLNLACPRPLGLIPRITNHKNNKEWNEISVYYKQESMQYPLALIWLTIKIFLYHLPIYQWHKCLLSPWLVIPFSGTLDMVQSWQCIVCQETSNVLQGFGTSILMDKQPNKYSDSRETLRRLCSGGLEFSSFSGSFPSQRLPLSDHLFGSHCLHHLKKFSV